MDGRNTIRTPTTESNTVNSLWFHMYMFPLVFLLGYNPMQKPK